MRKSSWFWMGVLGLALFVAFQGVDVQAGTTGKVQGVVRDAATGEPLPGANVVLEGTNRGATTDGEGYYLILSVDPGAYTLKASMVGYAASTKTDVRITSDITTTVGALSSGNTSTGIRGRRKTARPSNTPASTTTSAA